MPLLEFKKHINHLYPLVDEITLHLMGEPLSHPHFQEILEALPNNSEAKIILTTNGVLINKFADQIINTAAIKQVNFSIQSFIDNYTSPNKIQECLDNIIKFTKKSLDENPLLYINYRFWNDGVLNENQKYIDLINQEFSTELKSNVDVSHIKSKKVVGRFYLHFDSRFSWPNQIAPILGNRGRCHGVINHLGIHADGTVVPCCLDKEAVINLGNIDDGLDAILSSERALKMATGFKNGQLIEDLCQRCTYIKRFTKNTR